jgi:hypothetical protein
MKLNRLQIQDQNDARTSYWSTLLTIVAGIYIPLSFTTVSPIPISSGIRPSNFRFQGIFGMNLREINHGGPRWWVAVATALPLVALTIVVPLAFEKTVRLITRLMKSRFFGKIIYILFLLICFWFSFYNIYHLDLILPLSLAYYSLGQIWRALCRPSGRFKDFVFYVCFLVYILAAGISNDLTGESLVGLQLLQLLGVIGLILWRREEHIMAWWRRVRRNHDHQS